MRVGGCIGPLGNKFEVQIVFFETKMGGAVEPDFHEDGIFGTDPDGLTVGDLEELIVKAQGEIVGENPFDSDGKDFVEPVGGE